MLLLTLQTSDHLNLFKLIESVFMIGIFTSYYLSKRYLNKNLEELQNKFFEDYGKILDSLKKI